MGILERDSGTQSRAKQEYNRKKRQKRLTRQAGTMIFSDFKSYLCDRNPT